MNKQILFLTVITLASCSDPNSKPEYGDNGLPKNCRAIVQANIDEYHEVRNSYISYDEQMLEIDGIFDSLSRNCGAYGYSWD